MSKLLLPMIALALLLPSFAKAQPADAPAAQRFQWPAPSQVKVTESALKRGNTVEMSYKIDFQPTEQNRFTAKLTDIEFHKLNGQPISAAIQRGLQVAKTAFEANPSFVIDESGRLVDIVGLERTIEATGRLVDSNRQDGNGGKFAKAFENDKVKAMLKQAIAAYWVSWVEAWIEFPAMPGTTITEQFEETVVEGEPAIKGTRTYEHRGVVEGKRKLIHLKLTTVTKDPNLTRNVRALLAEFDRANGKPIDPEANALPNVFAESTVEVKIDPETLRPYWAKRTKDVRFDSNDAEFDKLKQRESHEYTFDWE